MIIWIATQEENAIFVDVLGVFSSVEKGKAYVANYHHHYSNSKQRGTAVLNLWVYDPTDQCWFIESQDRQYSYFLDSYELDKESLE